MRATREGTTSILQVTNLVTELPSGGHRYAGSTRSGRGFFLGVKFQYKFLVAVENEARKDRLGALYSIGHFWRHVGPAGFCYL